MGELTSIKIFFEKNGRKSSDNCLQDLLLWDEKDVSNKRIFPHSKRKISDAKGSIFVWLNQNGTKHVNIRLDPEQMTPKGLYLDSGSKDYSKPDDVTWETGISGTKGLSIFGYWTQQRYINMLPKEEKKEVSEIIYYFYKNSLLFLQTETPKIHPSNPQPTMQVSQKSVFLFNYN